MTCSCPASNKRIYYADIQPCPGLKGGLACGGSPHLSKKEVTICAQCGTAEFSIDEAELRWFRKEQSYRVK